MASYNILLMGTEYAKRDFFEHLIPSRWNERLDKLFYDKKTVMVNSIDGEKAKEDIVETENICDIWLSDIPYNVRLHCKCGDDDWFEKIYKYDQYEKIVIICNQQYENTSGLIDFIVRECVLLKEKMPEKQIVIMKGKAKNGATDIVKSKEIIQKFVKEWKVFCDVVVLEESDSIETIFLPKMKFLTDAKHIFIRKFEQKKNYWGENGENFKENFFVEFADDESDVANVLDKKVCGFKAVMGSSDIATTIIRNYQKNVYEEKVEKYISYYCIVMKEICIWDMERDLRFVRLETDKLLDKYMCKEKILSEKIGSPKDEIEYAKLEQKCGIKQNLYRQVTDLEKEIKEYFISRMKCNYNKVKNMIEEG